MREEAAGGGGPVQHVPAVPRFGQRASHADPDAPAAGPSRPDHFVGRRDHQHLERRAEHRRHQSQLAAQTGVLPLDSDAIDDQARKILSENAEVLKANSKWVITIEGHCDERGTAEYNLALADRRALAAKSYLVSLGIAADRLKTVSYGKEFPFDPGHDEDSWSQNRRAHFTLTAK